MKIFRTEKQYQAHCDDLRQQSLREWGECLAVEPDCEEDKYKEFFDIATDIERALLRNNISEDLNRIPNSYLDTIKSYLEHVKLNILEQTAKSINEVNQILYRNGCLVIIALLKKKLDESYKDTSAKRSTITRKTV
jgi:hypothetical protein